MSIQSLCFTKERVAKKMIAIYFVRMHVYAREVVLYNHRRKWTCGPPHKLGVNLHWFAASICA